MVRITTYVLKGILIIQVFLLNLNAQSIITTVAGDGMQGFAGDNALAINAKLYNPKDVCVDRSGDLYITDIGNNRIRKVLTSGVITTICGTGIAGYNGDNISAVTAELNQPFGIVCDTNGNIYITDYQNFRIREINPAGIITTKAGTGTAAFSGDNGQAAAAQINYSGGMILDSSGDFYFCDTYNNRIRKINTAGVITIIAGIGTVGYSGDGGPAVSAQVNHPGYLTFDKNNNLYFTDVGNHCIRMINNVGIISTIAGTGVAGFSGDNGSAASAQFNQPLGIICDGLGNLYISDELNHRVRKINTLGVIATIVGTGTGGYNGDNMVASSSNLYYPEGLAFDTGGNLYIADNYNNRIRKVTNVTTSVNELEIKNPDLKIWPNPCQSVINVEFEAGKEIMEIEIVNLLGSKIEIVMKLNQIDVSNLQDGIYFLAVKTKASNVTRKIIVNK